MTADATGFIIFGSQMNKPFIFLLMIFLHIIDDFCLQGWMASAKQKDWWKENAPQELYKYDWLCALIMHSLSWAFMIMLPIALAQGFCIDGAFVRLFILNSMWHAWMDHKKANAKVANLWIDQVFHISQIATTFYVMLCR